MMNCKVCNAELQEDMLFCSECGTKVETKEEQPEETLKCSNCGAELAPDVKFCSQCGTAVGAVQPVADSDSVIHNPNQDKVAAMAEKTIAKIKAKPKFYGIIAIVVIVVILGLSIISSLSNSESKSTGTSSSSKTSSSSTQVKNDAYYETIASRALYSAIQEKYSQADAGSTKYKINKTEKQGDYTIVYGKLYLYDKYGKATTGYVDGSGSYIRTFEVKIKNSTGKVSSCKIK